MTRIDDAWTIQTRGFMHGGRARGLAERTLDGRDASMRAFARWCRACGLASPDDVVAADVECYAATLTQPGPDARPLAAGTRRNRLTAVRLFFAWQTRAGFLRQDPCADLALPRAPRTLPHRGLDRRALNELRKSCDARPRTSKRNRALVEFMVATGVRRAECCALDIGDVDLFARWVSVRRGKGGRPRVIPISGAAVHWLRRYLSSRVGATPADPLFVTPTVRRYTPNRLGDLVKHLLRRAGIIGQGSCHRLRHTLATTMLENGADIRHIQAMLGHADISTTMIYASVLPLALKAVYDRTHPGMRRRWRRC